jgi:DNA-binding winged helix-turn-helix (wHTH) protein
MARCPKIPHGGFGHSWPCAVLTLVVGQGVFRLVNSGWREPSVPNRAEPDTPDAAAHGGGVQRLPWRRAPHCAEIIVYADSACLARASTLQASGQPRRACLPPLVADIRQGRVVNNDFRIGPWLVQPSLNTISRNGTSSRLEPKVMEVLVCLAEHTGEVVPKEKLLQAVWPDTFVSDDVLKRSVSELRHVFGDDAHESRVIETIPKRGYRLVAAVQPTNGVPLALPTELPGARRADTRRRSRLRAVGGVLGLIALMVACVVAFNVAGIREWLLPR